MKPSLEPLPFVWQTQGVCPAEIHFHLQDDILKEVRFVGGGCPGNAQLVSRLLKGRPVKEVLDILEGIVCRNNTSCADQLGRALIAAREGRLDPARSFRVYTDPEPRDRIALMAHVDGRVEVLAPLIHKMRKQGAQVIYCLGNLTGHRASNKETLALIREEGVLAIQGERDFHYAQGEEAVPLPPLDHEERDYLMRLPQVMEFHVGCKKGMIFFGRYLQDLPGFSDYEPFSLEMNMVCSLTRFLQDESVFPALETMVRQFDAQIVLFGQIKKWGHWTLGGIDFISVGPALRGKELTWGLLQADGERVHFKIMKEPYSGVTEGS